MMCNSYFALYQIVFIIESFISKVTKAQLRPRKICLINRHAWFSQTSVLGHLHLRILLITEKFDTNIFK